MVEGGVTYDRTPIGTYINGWADLDGDGIIDCVDPEVTCDRGQRGRRRHPGPV